ncbi:MAG: ankyrin repeat domain-containing protein [Rickettsiaceae bacterium]|nr:ankyrin repeat domain-containing protein [Rickettsiaceae bacterium]
MITDYTPQESILIAAIKTKNPIAFSLIDSIQNLNFKIEGHTPLEVAFEIGRNDLLSDNFFNDVCLKLLEKGADNEVTINNKYGIMKEHTIVSDGKEMHFVYVLHAEEALIEAITTGNLHACTEALEDKANPIMPSSAGITPLTYAIEKGNMEIVQTLINFISNPEWAEKAVSLAQETENTAAIEIASAHYDSIPHSGDVADTPVDHH